MAAKDIPQDPARDVKHAFIWYSAAEDNTDKILEPVWQDASQLWARLKGNHPDPNQRIEWVKKVCYGQGWSKGPDYDECPLEKTLPNHLEEFPTLRLYTDSGEYDFQGDRTVPELFNFVRQNVDPPEVHPSRNPPWILEDRPAGRNPFKIATSRSGSASDVPQDPAAGINSAREAPDIPSAVPGPPAASGLGPALGCGASVILSAHHRDLRLRWTSCRHPRRLLRQRSRSGHSDFL